MKVSKTYTVPAISYTIVSVDENPAHDVPNAIHAWLVTYDKIFGDKGGIAHSSLWDDIAKHAKEYVAEKFNNPANQLKTKMYPGRGTVLVLMEGNPYIVNIQ